MLGAKRLAKDGIVSACERGIALDNLSCVALCLPQQLGIANKIRDAKFGQTMLPRPE